jgi:hypothetical protein
MDEIIWWCSPIFTMLFFSSADKYASRFEIKGPDGMRRPNPFYKSIVWMFGPMLIVLSFFRGYFRHYSTSGMPHLVFYLYTALWLVLLWRAVHRKPLCRF